MIAHSILQGGPGFPGLCPATFSFMLYMDKERPLEELPSAGDIPKNVATIGLLSLINEVSTHTYILRSKLICCPAVFKTLVFTF